MEKDFNIIDAFLALNEIDDEEVKNMIKPRRRKAIHEGKDFSLNSDAEDLDQAREMIHQEQDDTELEVIDPDADSIDHLKNKEDYVGQIILRCNKCMANRFIDADKLVADEDDPEKFNVEDECPHCHSIGAGYEQIGQVGKVVEPEKEEPAEAEEEEEEAPEGEEEAKVDNDEAADEISFDNDLEEEPADSGNNIQPESTEGEEATPEVDSEIEDDDEEKDGMETDSNEDEDDFELPALEDEEEEDDEEEDKKKEESLNEELQPNSYAKEAWMMNEVISCMNDEEAYESWLYSWPEDESEEECAHDFGDVNSLEELREAFDEIYSAYHSNGLFEAPKDVERYAHEQDMRLDLPEIENLKRMRESKEELQENFDDDTVENLLNNFLEPENIDTIVIMDGQGEILFEGSYEELAEENLELLSEEVAGWDVGDGFLTCNVDMSSDNGAPLEYILDKFTSPDDDRLIAWNVDTEEEEIQGTVEEILDECGEAEFVSFDNPERLEITINKNFDDDYDYEERDYANEGLFEQICAANKLRAHRVNNPKSDEYWINESLHSGDDLKMIYEKYVRPIGDAELIEKFKSETGYLDAVDEAQIEMYGHRIIEKKAKKSSKKVHTQFPAGNPQKNMEMFNHMMKPSAGIGASDGAVEAGGGEGCCEAFDEDNRRYDLDVSDDYIDLGQGELIDAPEESEERAVVDPNMSPEEVALLQRINEVARDTAEAINQYYNIDADPGLIVADIIQDLRLVSGAIRPQDLEDSPINNLTIEMLNDYNQTEEFVSELIQMFGGQPLDMQPEAKLERALASLNTPSFDTENIYKAIGSNRFIDMARRGAVPYIGVQERRQLEKLTRQIRSSRLTEEAKDEKECRDCPDKEEQEADKEQKEQVVESYKDRKELANAIQECKNNNTPYRVRRSTKEGFRYDLITESKELKEANLYDRLLAFREKSKRNKDDEVDFNEQQFDEEMNKYFDEAYDQTVIYKTLSGNIDKSGKIVLEGLVDDGRKESEIRFILEPVDANLNEALTKEVIEGRTYKVSNNLSEEVFEFKAE